MHVFRSEPDDYVDDGPPSGKTRRWRIVYTRQGREKALARFLQRHGIPFYLPLQGGRVLMPRYLFMSASEDEVLGALSSLCICRILPVPDETQLVRELENLDRLLASGAPLMLEPVDARGRMVRLVDGALHGIKVRIIQHNGAEHLHFCVGRLDCGVSVKIGDLTNLQYEPVA